MSWSSNASTSGRREAVVVGQPGRPTAKCWASRSWSACVARKVNDPNLS